MKFLFCFLLLAILSSGSYSQGFRAGLLLGMNASQVDGDRLEGYNKAGIHAGIFVVNEFDEQFSLITEMKYTQKGSRRISDPENGDTEYYLLRLSYVEVPFIFQAKFFKRWTIEAGTGFGYLFRAREDVDGNEFREPDRPFRKFEVPFVGGAGYSFTDNIRLSFRYSYSILAIREHPGSQVYYFDRGQYNNLLSTTLHILL